MLRQPIELQTLCFRARRATRRAGAQRAIGHLPGAFVTKTIKGQSYYYYQHLEPGGAKRQLYIGRRDAVLDAVVAKFTQARVDGASDAESIRGLVTP